MADMWSGIPIDSSTAEGEWLYRAGVEVRGPLPYRALVDKLLRGDIDVSTPVAKEGGDFHPVARVAAFTPHIPEAKKRAAQRAAGKSRRLVLFITLIALGGASGGGYIVWTEYQKAKMRRLRAQADATVALARKREEAKALPQMGLVALVSLGTEDDVKIRSAGKKVRAGGRRDMDEPSEEEVVSSCKLTQQDIFGTLSRHLAKINVCVQDEKSRDKTGQLPATLELDFIVLPDGRVSEFKVTDRHYRTGPMNNCLIKAFNTISFPKSSGANCPVTIPIKIGG